SPQSERSACYVFTVRRYDSASPFRERERIAVRNFSTLHVRSSQRPSPCFSTPRLSPLLDRGGEETLAAMDAEQTPPHFQAAAAISISPNWPGWIARTCFRRINSRSARNVTTISTRDAISAHNSENFSAPPSLTLARMVSILSETV